MSLFGDFIARMRAGDQQAPQGQYGLMQQLAGAQPQHDQYGALMQEGMAQAQPQSQSGLMQQIMQGAQGGGFGAVAPQSQGNWMSQLQGTGFGAASPGGHFQRFRQLYGRDPMSQQELAMMGPTASQGMG